MTHDPVNRPVHYTSSPAHCECGTRIECITITEHLGFCIGNAIKYLWRADLKNGVEDLEKAVWYIQREIGKRKPGAATEVTSAAGQDHAKAEARWESTPCKDLACPISLPWTVSKAEDCTRCGESRRARSRWVSQAAPKFD